MKNIKNIINQYETLCNQNKAQCIEAKNLHSEMEEWFENSIYEFCAHNAAILGFRRYEKYKYFNTYELITKQEYKDIKEVI